MSGRWFSNFISPCPLWATLVPIVLLLPVGSQLILTFLLIGVMTKYFEDVGNFLIYWVSFDLLVIIFYNVATKIVRNYQNEYQPVAALIFIFLRELNAWVTRKCISSMSSGDEPGSQVYGIIIVGMRHTMIISYMLGSIATTETGVFLMLLGFIYNIYLCIKIVWVKTTRPEDTEKQIDLIQELSINELIEIVTPLSFILAFISAYYGPNGELLGQIRATIWQYEANEDAPGFLLTILLLFVVDFCSTIVNSFILWFYLKINFFAVLITMEKEYGVQIFLNLGYFLLTVST